MGASFYERLHSHFESSERLNVTEFSVDTALGGRCVNEGTPEFLTGSIMFPWLIEDPVLGTNLKFVFLYDKNPNRFLGLTGSQLEGLLPSRDHQLSKHSFAQVDTTDQDLKSGRYFDGELHVQYTYRKYEVNGAFQAYIVRDIPYEGEGGTYCYFFEWYEY